ncbi:MAG: glycoside hydrolase family 1 protein [Chitinophagales bacterium]|nr:glycoside hydrolase family 1 protein [Chitinophagales bacterium]
MLLSFPNDFFFGTSTAAYQIETAFEHDWLGVKSKDGYTFHQTCDHEKRFKEDAEIIAYCAPHYRMSLMWSKLQRSPFAELHRETVEEYQSFIADLKQRGVKIMMVLHHFTNPLWFSQKGNWEKKENIALWVDFCKKAVDEFGEHVTYWNTFNEPNVYVSNGWVLGQFPPFKNNILAAVKAIGNMGEAHNIVYDYIKSKFPQQPVGISHNTVIFSAENILGWLPAKVSDWWFMERLLKPFTAKLDFFGMSYYAKISHDPLPITYIDTPEKIKALGKRHDDMWEYYPQGLKECIERYWNRYRLPVIVTENGICAADDSNRVNAMKDYMRIIHECLQQGIAIRGYYWWSTFDNFEWNLGPTYRFGLYETNLETKDRTKRPSADIYHRLAYEKQIEV